MNDECNRCDLAGGDRQSSPCPSVVFLRSLWKSVCQDKTIELTSRSNWDFTVKGRSQYCQWLYHFLGLAISLHRIYRRVRGNRLETCLLYWYYLLNTWDLLLLPIAPQQMGPIPAFRRRDQPCLQVRCCVLRGPFHTDVSRLGKENALLAGIYLLPFWICPPRKWIPILTRPRPSWPKREDEIDQKCLPRTSGPILLQGRMGCRKFREKWRPGRCTLCANKLSLNSISPWLLTEVVFSKESWAGQREPCQCCQARKHINWRRIG